MKKFLTLQNLIITSCVAVSIFASLINIAFIQNIYFNLGGKTIFMNDYSHIIFYGILGIIFRKYKVTFIRGITYIILFATSMELLQTFVPSRNADIGDIISGIIGWLSGFTLLTIYGLVVKTEEKKCMR